jgi:hypothetical protein
VVDNYVTWPRKLLILPDAKTPITLTFHPIIPIDFFLSFFLKSVSQQSSLMFHLVSISGLSTDNWSITWTEKRRRSTKMFRRRNTRAFLSFAEQAPPTTAIKARAAAAAARAAQAQLVAGDCKVAKWSNGRLQRCNTVSH